MDKNRIKLSKLVDDLKNIKSYFLNKIKELRSPVHIYTHLDADGLSSGAILGKSLYREKIPFQITVLRQLEKQEIRKISKRVEKNKNFVIFSDFGSGQFLELQNEFIQNNNFNSFLILDHHLPQNVSNKEEFKKIKEIHEKTKNWQINPYFFEIDGSVEISGAGLSYCFAKCLNQINIDLSPLAIIGAIGDIQNQGENKSFLGLNTLILEDAIKLKLIEVVNDLNFPSMKPLNEAIAFSSEINLPGLSKNPNRALVFLKNQGILMENSEGKVKTLNELNKEEKQKITSAIIEYASIKLDLEPNKIIEKLIANRYLLRKEAIGSELHDAKEFSNLLNACGRTHNSSSGIAIAMGDRKEIYQQSKSFLKEYKKKLVESLSWVKENEKIIQMDSIQYFFGDDKIPEYIIGTISSMLVFGDSEEINKSKPIFGLAKRSGEEVYKVSGRAHKTLVKKGVNLSKAIRDACEKSNLDVLGGGHPPAAGTKIPIEKTKLFLKNCDIAVHNQLKEK